MNFSFANYGHPEHPAKVKCCYGNFNVHIVVPVRRNMAMAFSLLVNSYFFKPTKSINDRVFDVLLGWKDKV